MSAVYFALANNPFSQNWTDTGLISVDDNWDNVPSIVGFRGDGLTGIDPQTILAEGTGVVDVNANQTNPNTFTTGGVAEFEISDPVVALQGSGTAGAPFLLLYLNTTGVQNVSVNYLLRDLDGSTDNSIQPIALQYRVGTTGDFINISAGFVADASSGPSLATLTTTVSAVLPSAANNQAQVQVRIITANALGSDEWIGIDNINVSSTPIAAPPVIPPTPPIVPPVPPVIPTPSIQITEYLYSGNNGEFVELTNIGLAPIDFAGWSFDDNTRTAGSFSLSAFGIVQPNESVILTESEAGAFRSVWNLAPIVRVIGGSNQAIGRADELNIYDATGQLVDRLTYNDETIPGTIRALNVSGTTPLTNLDATTINSAWVLSALGDNQNSRTSTGGDIGSPGNYFTGSTVNPPVTPPVVPPVTPPAPTLPTVNLSVSSNTGSEANTSRITVTATASSALTSAQTVSLGVTGTDITAGDFYLTSSTIAIPSGQTTGSVTFIVADDAIAEGTETAILTIATPSAGVALGTTISQNIAIANNTNSFLTRVGTITSTNGAEIPAFDPASDRLFTVAGNTVEIFSVSPTGALALAGALSPGFTAAAGSEILPNSVAVSNGIVAVAYAVRVIATGAQQIGQVSFYNAADGAFLKAVEVGFLPDQLTFTPDGKKVLVANEGEPNSYNQANSFDPEGSISIINITNGVATATVQTATFTAFNSQIDALRAAGVRIFGPNATVAQDLEPEYIAIDPNGRTAQIVLQENNAIAILDIDNARIIDILPLGLKNFNQPTVTGLKTYEFTNLPSLGNTAAGQSIPLGGFSGLTYDGIAANGNLKFITNTDRGPNGDPTGINRPFFLPNFTPEIVRFELNQTTGNLAITQRIQLKDSLGNNLSGRPNTAISANANQAFNDEVPVDLRGNVLPRDPLGADLEGIVVDPTNGSFWLVDEYRPAIYNFNSTGVLIERFVPIGTAAAAGQPVGTFGTEVLPEVLGQRRQNRGFEAVALQDGKLLAFVQSPIRNPASLSNATLNSSQNIRIVEFDPITKATRQFIYILDNPPAANADDTRADKVGDAVAIGNGEFLIVERDDDSIATDAIGDIQKKIYRFSLGNATDISSLPALINGKSVDQLTTAELAAAGVNPIRKSLYVDLTEAGYNTVEKVEGLTFIDRNTIAVINDNDFTVAGIAIDQATGTFIPASEPTPTVLGIISLQNNGLDASDRDLTATTGRINIQNYPLFGVYQPDAIASFVANGQTYYISANEGDARDYTGFAEEVRVGAATYTLDPAIFPDAANLKNIANLGRLTVSNATGNTDADPEFEQIVTFGGRSFSIRDSANNLVFDSGDQLERITAELAPTLFNSDGTVTGFDTRSDNKGPEPEGVVVGVINNRTYAFIGLERVGDVIVYEITDPTQPVFIQYINTPEDRATEGLAFISATDSPTGKPLLVTASEASNTVTVFEINVPTRISDIQGARQRSPLEGQAVTTRGIVTALATNGFYLQDPTPDSSDSTSEGIFVFTSSAPNAALVTIGTSLQVSGTVSEFRPGNNPENLTTTQIGGNTANPLAITAIASLGRITPTIIGAGGRAIPTQSIQPTPVIQTLQNISASALLSEIQQPNLTPNTAATGNFTYRFNGNQVTIAGSYSGLTSDRTSINLNLGAARTFGTVLGDLTVTGTTGINTNFTGTFTLDAAQLTEFQAGRAYVNVSSANFPVGELRGQLGPSIELSAVFDPTTSGLDFFESLEGTLVQINNPVAVSPTNGFGEIFVLADNGDGATGRTARGGIVASPGDFNPERIQIDDDLAGIATNPNINVGGTLSTIQGVVSYNFNNFEIQVTALPTVLSNPLTREVTPLVGTANQLTIGAFNVENLDPSDTVFPALAGQIVNNLRSPDILSIEEVQDNNGATNNGVVDATTTYNLLISAIAAAGGPTYQFRQINPENNQDGGQPGGNIRVGFLFNPSRVTFVDRAGGTATNATGVVNNNGNLETTLSPGRLQDSNLADGAAFNASRKPLVGEFLFNGRQVIVVSNHLNSKGGDQPLSGPTQSPLVFSETQRLQQAQIINDFVDSALAINPNANIVVLGDINDFEFSEPTNVLRGVPNGVGTPVLTSLLTTLPANERYTYNFQGNAQVLDQILVSNSLISKLDAFDVLNINSEFFDQISDHDPSVARFNLPAIPPTTVADTFSVNEDTVLNIAPPGVLANDVSPNSSSVIALVINLPTQGALTANLDGSFSYSPEPNFSGVDSFTYIAENNFGAKSAETTVTINVVATEQVGGDLKVGTSTNDVFVANGSQVVFTGDGLDLVQVKTSGLNRIYSGKDADTLFALSGDRLFGKEGDDLIDASGGTGSNRLYGGDGDDLLVAGVNDFLFGNDGNDILLAGRGGSNLFGGLGNDQFFLAGDRGVLPTAINTIVDFLAGTDTLVITAIAGVTEFSNVSLTQQGNNTLVAAAGTNLALLTGIQASTLTVANFSF